MEHAAHAYLLSIFETYAQIPPSEWKKTKACLKPLRLEENEFFIMQGDKPDRFAFIISGILRVFCITESGAERTLAFRVQGQFVAAYTPYLFFIVFAG